MSTFPSQSAVDYKKNEPKALFFQCIDGGEMQHIQIPTILYQIKIQKRYEAAKATIKHFKRPVVKSKNMLSIASHIDKDVKVVTNL